MASPTKIIVFCLCMLLSTLGIVVEAGSHSEVLEPLLAAGIITMLLKNKGHGYTGRAQSFERQQQPGHSYGHGNQRGYRGGQKTHSNRGQENDHNTQNQDAGFEEYEHNRDDGTRYTTGNVEYGEDNTFNGPDMYPHPHSPPVFNPHVDNLYGPVK